MKKTIILFICLLLCVAFPMPIQAEENSGDDYNFGENLDQYTKLCSQDSTQWTDADRAACRAYSSYLQQNSTTFAAKMAEIQAQLPDIEANIAQYTETVRNYDVQIADLNAQIASLNTDIAVKEAEIVEKQTVIDETQAEVDELKASILERMAATQPTMRLNQYLDIIMGAKDLNDLVRRANALADIDAHDKSQREQLIELMQVLEREKKELEEAKAILDEQKAQVVVLQEDALAKRQEAEYVKSYYLEQEAELQAQQAAYSSATAAVSAIMANIGDEALNAIEASPGWTYPVPGARITGHTWQYYIDSGGLHLGMDFAASKGTPVYAAGNGVILNSADGCGDGYLGNACAGSGGVIMGGNQVYLLSVINGSLYVISYNHLLAGTPIATGTIVTAGQVVGQVGTSGNSSGPHCHIEIFYLGAAGAGTLSAFASSWNGDMSFGAHWGSAAMSYTCPGNGFSAPCRIRPESVFGG